jgi:hypothetical protein
MQPQIIAAYDQGVHNKDMSSTITRLEREGAYKDLSTVIIIPALGSIPTKAVASWWNMMTPPNQKVAKFFAVGMEVGAAYSQTIEGILADPNLSTWKYILTLEHDNIPPPDGLLKLLETAEAHPEFAAIGGLYFTKGPGGVAQIWGNVNEAPLNFKPQKPVLGSLVECNGTGMGFTLFRMAMFKDPKLRRPWFKTAASQTEGVYTQDLYAWTDFKKHGYRAAIDCTVRVGHYDQGSDVTW